MGAGKHAAPWGGGSVCALLWLSWRCVHSPASWANLKVFQSKQTKKLDPHAMILHIVARRMSPPGREGCGPILEDAVLARSNTLGLWATCPPSKI